MATGSDPKAETRKTLRLGLGIAAGSVGILALIAVFRPSEPTADAIRNPVDRGVQQQPSSPPPAGYTPTVPVPTEMSPELREKYWNDMKAKALAQPKVHAPVPNPAPPSKKLITLTKEQLDEQRAIVLDAGRRPVDRCFAWKTLQQAGESGAEVNQPIIQILRSNTDEQTRSLVVDTVRSGLIDEDIKAELIDRLRFDPSDRVRHHAALTLAGIGQDPVARVALEYAMNTDPYEGVRAAARAVIYR